MLLVSQTTEYAMRAMAHLAAQPPGSVVASAALAQAAGIPAYYVSKVMRRLVVAGLCTAQRGHHGGFALAREPSAITFADIVAAADPDGHGGGCAFGYDRCDARCPCPLHESWSALKGAFAAWADQTSLGDVKRYAERPDVRRPGRNRRAEGATRRRTGGRD